MEAVSPPNSGLSATELSRQRAGPVREGSEAMAALLPESFHSVSDQYIRD